LESRATPGSLLDTLLADALRMAPLAALVAEPQFHPLTNSVARPPAFAEDFFAGPFSPRETPPTQAQPAQPTSGQGEDASTRRKSILDDVLLDELASASSAPVRLSFAPTLEPPRGGPSVNEPALFAPDTRSGAEPPAGDMSDTGEVSGPRDAFASLSVAATAADGGTTQPKGSGSPMVVELPLVSVSTYDPVAAELRSPPGTTTGVFEFDRTGDTAADLTVKFRVDGKATPDADYTGLGQLTTETIGGETVLTGTAVIPAGQSWVRVMVMAVDDTLVEGDEDARLTVLGTAEYNPDPDRPEATVAIADNDPMGDPSQQVWVERVDPTAQKDYENPTNPQNIGKVELRRSIASGLLNVNYSVTGTAALNTDYSLWGPVASGYSNQITDTKLAATGKVTFADGQDRLWVRVVPVGSGGPAVLTADLTVTAGAGYTVADPHEGDVGVSGDRAPGWAVQPNPDGGYSGQLLDVWVTTGQEMTYAGYGPYYGDASAAEAGQDPGSILVTYQYQSDDPNFIPPDPPSQAWVVGGTAEDGVDYTMTVTRVVAARTDESIYFPTTGKTVYRISSVDRIDITPIDDAEWEGDETVDVAVGRASSDTGGVIGGGTVTITDDDPGLPTVSVEAPDGVSTEWGPPDLHPSTGSYRITRDDTKLALPLTVSYEFDGTATHGEDYTVTGKDSVTGQQITLLQTGTVTFPAGQNSVELKLTPIDDAEDEGPETATLTLLTGSAYQVSTPTADVQIVDNSALSISGRVWFDGNDDGQATTDEHGLRLKVDLIQDGDLLAEVTSEPNGSYKFPGILTGTYAVQVVTPESVFTNTTDGIRTVTVGPSVVTGVDFGLDEVSPISYEGEDKADPADGAFSLDTDYGKVEGSLSVKTRLILKLKLDFGGGKLGSAFIDLGDPATNGGLKQFTVDAKAMTEGKYEFAQFSPKLATLDKVALHFGVEMKLRFTPNQANKDKDFYWVQATKDLFYVKEGTKWELLTLPDKNKWKLDGDLLGDATRPFAYAGQKLGKDTDHSLYDFPGYSVTVPIKTSSFNPDTKKLTVTLDVSPKDQVAADQKKLVDEYMEDNPFKTYLLPVGGDGPVGRVNWGYTRLTKGNMVTKDLPTWAAADKNDPPYKEATGQ
jgi:hypothetical protein